MRCGSVGPSLNVGSDPKLGSVVPVHVAVSLCVSTRVPVAAGATGAVNFCLCVSLKSLVSREKKIAQRFPCSNHWSSSLKMVAALPLLVPYIRSCLFSVSLSSLRALTVALVVAPVALWPCRDAWVKNKIIKNIRSLPHFLFFFESLLCYPSLCICVAAVAP